MPAPTALQRAPESLANEEASAGVPISTGAPDVVAIDTDQDAQLSDPQSQDLQILPLSHDPSSPTAMNIDTDESSGPLFTPETASPSAHRREERSVRVPPHRMTPLKANWAKIYPPLVEHLGLQVRMNVAKKNVELRTSKHTTSTSAIQKGADFLQAFMLGFALDDAIALLRLDDLYIQSFEVKDVKSLGGEHASRAVGRIAGKDGKTKFAIENASRTRIVLADQKVHILGGFKNIGMAREAVVSLILGSPPGKVYGNLRTVSARMKERF